VAYDTTETNLSRQFIDTVISQHNEEAAFLWISRETAIRSPQYCLIDITNLDSRIDAHIDGLRISGNRGWEISKEALSQADNGVVFAAAVMALGSGDENRIQTVIDAGIVSLELSRGLISALGWLHYAQAEGHISKLLSSASPDLRRLGIAASAIHRNDPGFALSEAIADKDLLLRARALRAVGELGRTDLVTEVQKNLTSEDDKCRFSAAWSAASLGDLNSVSVLRGIASLDVPYNEEAAKLALRRMDLVSALRWQRDLAENPESARLAAVGAGVIGDPTLIPWLIEQMKLPELARVAGESFTMITGVDIAYEDLEGEQPEGFESGPTEDPEDETVEMDPDENLPWPNSELIHKWWSNHRNNFQSGTRYLIGKPTTEDWFQQVLRIGRQRQRSAAALELVLKQPGQPLFEVRAPGFRQQQLLGLKVTR
jgi:uncharacterized protein (TIGR02270 family)